MKTITINKIKRVNPVVFIVSVIAEIVFIILGLSTKDFTLKVIYLFPCFLFLVIALSSLVINDILQHYKDHETKRR